MIIYGLAYSLYFSHNGNLTKTILHFYRHGFNTPVLIKEKSGLGLTVPDPDFTVTDVKNLVGPKRVVDIMDCSTQKNSEMTMKDWDEYYHGPNRTRKLNVISLEFSYTKMEPMVVAPKVIRQIDWTDNVWPRHLKDAQTEVIIFLDTLINIMIILASRTKLRKISLRLLLAKNSHFPNY